MKTTQSYKSRDFYAAAYLLCSGMELLSHEKENGLTVFEFENSKKLQTLINDYYSLQGVVNALSYGVAIRNLKAIIHGDIISNRNDNAKQYIER